MSRTRRDLVAELQYQAEDPFQIRLAQVQSIQTGPPLLVTVNFGDLNTTIPAGPVNVPGVAVVGGYGPSVGDLVIVLQDAAGSLVCLGDV